jgi:hypothetical protein
MINVRSVFSYPLLPDVFPQFCCYFLRHFSLSKHFRFFSITNSCCYALMLSCLLSSSH